MPDAAGDQRLRADGLGKILQIEFVLGDREALRVVDDQHVLLGGEPAEHDARMRRP